jgi:shikimate kinase
MGAGKTSKGRKLATRLGIRFADMDEIIEEQTGLQVQEIFQQKGEKWFRAKETEVLHQLGESNEEMVISTGGGTPCFNDNMDFINSTGHSVYLQMNAEDLVNRLIKSQKPVRPLIADKTGEELLEYVGSKLLEREPFYLKSKQVIQAENLRTKDLIAALRI